MKNIHKEIFIYLIHQVIQFNFMNSLFESINHENYHNFSDNAHIYLFL